MNSKSLSSRSCLAIILAAGEGTRMRSSLPKVLHSIAGRSMLAHVLAVVKQAGADHIAVVVGPDRKDVEKEALAAGAEVFVQKDRLGTAHAVLAAEAAIARGFDDVLIAYADTPLVQVATFTALRQPLKEGAAVVALGFRAQDPSGYGRLITKDDQLLAIREDKDASPDERAVTFCNAGLMAFQGSEALSLLNAISNQNAKGEFYLTDAVEISRSRNLKTTAVIADENDVCGVNDRIQLSEAEAIMQKRLRHAAMTEGVTMIAPDTVFLSHDTRLSRDVTIHPHVVFGPGVVVEEGVTIHAFSHLEGAHLEVGASIGPYARLRPGSVLKRKARIGNFVEVKNTIMGEGAKANHLTYLGDAVIGDGANIGAGTITCNYDGFNKFKTKIGDNAFIGSNSALVAPLTIGIGAYIGSGSVVTQNVPDNALAVARNRPVIKEGWGAAFREKFKKP
jgi:bifunctional UDP-N-acetylglucosamine pyrophosphorylase / glucosamine-1-phosphate N-acetyltransferase